jgi:hypothetical protein
MVRCQVKKVVAVCFLESAKSAMEQLGQYRMQMAQKAFDVPRDLTSMYGELRRLRDYLQRCVASYPDAVELDFTPNDQNLLVACCRRSVELLDHRLENGKSLSGQEHEWLVRKLKVLSDWAVEFAQKPLVELPLPRFGSTTTGARALTTRINAKLYNSTGMPGFHSGADLAQLPHSGVERASTGFQSEREQSLPEDDSATPAPESPDDGAGTEGNGALRFDVRQIRDPRLRSLMVLDLRAYDRAVQASDHRLAAVHLSSILEGAVLDHAMPRRVELALTGGPDSWNPQEILLRILGEHCTPKDRGFIYHVFTARNLIRPTSQLVSPTVVTPSSLQKLTEFVCRALREMGFTTGAGAEPAATEVPADIGSADFDQATD